MVARCRFLGSLIGIVAIVLGTSAVVSAGDVITKPAALRTGGEKYATVELFAGVDAGKLEAKLIPRDSKKARVFIINKTGQPLNVRLPATFAGQPVLAQFVPPGGPNIGTNQPNMQKNQPQMIIGPFNRMPTPGGQQPGMPMFNLPPEKTAEFRVECVCLDYGKPDPRPVMPYRLVPAETVASAETVAMIEEFGRSKYSQRAAQAAAWHLANSMSWEKLTALRGELVSVGVREPYFTRQQLDDAHKLVDAARSTVSARKTNGGQTKPPPRSPSPGSQAAR